MFFNYYFLFIVNLVKFCEPNLMDNKKNVIESLNQNLNIKHFSIIKDFDFHIDHKIFLFAKRIILSREKIFMSFMSVPEMNISMNEYYKTPVEYYDYSNKEKPRSLIEKRMYLVYPPRTIVMPYGKNVNKIIDQLFVEANAFVVSKYKWLIFNNPNEFVENPEKIYIPYNCQFLVVEDQGVKKLDYVISELYRPSIRTAIMFSRHFGIWNVYAGLLIPESDFYQRRFDMNGTDLIAAYQEGADSRIKGNKEIVNVTAQMMNWKLVLKPIPPRTDIATQDWDLFLQYIRLNYINFFPNYIGPFWKNKYRFYIPYNEKYAQRGLTPLLQPFSFDLWMAILAWSAISFASMAIIWKLINKIQKSELHQRIIMSDCVYEPFDSILNQYGGKIPNDSTFRIVSLAARVVPLVLAPLYTSAIISFILIPIIELPFTNLKEFVQDGTYKAGIDGYAALDYSFNASNDELLQRMARDFIIYLNGSTDETFSEEAKRVCYDYKLALLYERSLENLNCSILKIHSPIFLDWMIMPAFDESPYQAVFNRIIKSLHSHGIIKRMSNVTNEKSEGIFTMMRSEGNEDENFELINLAPIFVFISTLYIFSLIILLVEIIIFKKCKFTSKTKKISEMP